LKKHRVFHPKRNPAEIGPVQIVTVQVIEHLLAGTPLREIGPRLGIYLLELIHHLEGEGPRSGDDLPLGRHLHGIMRKAAGTRKIEMIFDGLSPVGFQVKMHAPGGSPVEYRDRTLGNLQQNVQFPYRRGGIGYHELRPVYPVRQEFVRDIIIHLFVPLIAVAFSMGKIILADQDRAVFFVECHRQNFLVNHQHGAFRCQGQGAVRVLNLVLFGLKG